jgi:uncharacterized protein (TIGR03032 family)
LATVQKGRTSLRTPKHPGKDLTSLWHHHHGQWRNPEQITSQWRQAKDIDLSLLQFSVRGQFWSALQNMTLIISREYEHMLIALSLVEGHPQISYFSMPHPSGIAFDKKKELLYIASTRNPNQIFDLAPVDKLLARLDVDQSLPDGQPLVPIRSRFFPGCLYMHDLAIIGGELHANAVGQNAIVKLNPEGQYERVWWPACIDSTDGPVFGQNYIQLNSIAAGNTINQSYFSASCEQISSRRPGHKNFPVDKRGVIFSGKTREPIVRGLTRPHSARINRGLIWVDNSGYGELGYVENGLFEPIIRFPGWTRGLCFTPLTAFVGTSRVIPKFSQYAPGLDVNKSQCGIHAVDLQTGKLLGSMIWPSGNQIFAIEAIPANLSTGFPFVYKSRLSKGQKQNLFYSFSIRQPKNNGTK